MALSDQDAAGFGAPSSQSGGAMSDAQAMAFKPSAEPSMREKLSFPVAKTDFMGAVAHGGSFGLSDEVEAGLSAPVTYAIDALRGKIPKGASLGDYYQGHLEAIREGLKDYADKHPVFNAAGEVVGSLLDLNPEAAGNAVANGIHEAAKQGAKVGATMGAASGFGDAEGGVKNRLIGAAEGGVGGAAVGAAAPYVIGGLASGVSKASSMIKDAIAPWTDDLDTFINKTAASVLNKAAGEGGATFEKPPLPGMTPNTGQATNNPGLKWLQRSIEQGTPEGQAGREASETANNQVIRKAIGDLGDLGTHPEQAMREAILKGMPSEAPEDQVLGMAEQALGKGNFHDTITDLTKSRSLASTPLYKQAEDYNPVTTDRLQQFAADPDIRKGMTTGIKLAKREALSKGKPFDPNSYAVTGFDEAGDPQIGPVPTWKTWFAGVEGLGQMINAHRNEITQQLPKTKEVISLVELKNALLDQLDDLNPIYKSARAVWSGPSQSMDALTSGRNIFKGDSEMTAQRIARLAPGDMDYYRMGVMRALGDVANKSSDSAASLDTLLSRPIMQQKLSAAFGGEGGFDNFLSKATSILNPQTDIGRAVARNATGDFALPDSALADQFIRSGKGAPEAFKAYLDTIRDNPEGLQAARDAFAQKFLNRVEQATPDLEGDANVSAAKIGNFLDQHQHVVNSRIFTDDQRDLIQRISDAADMAQRTARAGARGGSDTFAKLQGKTFLDELIGPGAAKLVTWSGRVLPAAGAAIGGKLAGYEGAAAGAAIGQYGATKLQSAMYDATRDKVVSLVTEAMNNPELAQTLMQMATKENALKVPAEQRKLIYSLLGVSIGRPAIPAVKDQPKLQAAE